MLKCSKNNGKSFHIHIEYKIVIRVYNKKYSDKLNNNKTYY